MLSRDQLLSEVWGYQYTGGTRTVDVHIRRLREKLPLLNGALEYGEAVWLQARRASPGDAVRRGVACGTYDGASHAGRLQGKVFLAIFGRISAASRPRRLVFSYTIAAQTTRRIEQSLTAEARLVADVLQRQGRNLAPSELDAEADRLGAALARG